MNDPFGTYRCTAPGVAHYFLPGSPRPLCGAGVGPGEPAAETRKGAGGLHWRQPVCPACMTANVRRWIGGGK